ncbi:MAG TPA: O-methyltransferase [Thermoanaerobaculia bacterium]|nr:O-methyltransferase [Thermoanaerobaculia bacterium]
MKDRIDALLHRRQAEYLESLTPQRSALLERMETFAAENDHPIADAEVAQFLRVLVTARRPRRILEIGTNIGYSVVVMGSSLDQDATIETIEIDRRTLLTAREFVKEASLPCHVVFHEGAALEVLRTLAGTFDFLFIDCVKTEYGDYLDVMMPKLERGAVIVCDNLLWKGQVAEGVRDKATDALRAFNRRLAEDPRLVTSILPLGDGTGISVVV